MGFLDLKKQFGDARVQRQKKRRHVAEGRLREYVQQRIDEQYRDDYRKKCDISQMIDVGFNLFELATRRMASIYNRHVTRRWLGDTGPEDSRRWDAVVSGMLNPALQEVSQLAIACGVCFVQPYMLDGQINYTVIPADVAAVRWRTQTTVDEIAYMIDENRYAYWDAKVYEIWQDGRLVKSGPNDIGTPPVSVYRSTYPGATTFWGSRTMETLLEATMNIAVNRSQLRLIRKRQSHLQLARKEEHAEIGSTTELAPQKVYTGESEVLEGDYYVLSLQASVKELTEANEIEIRRAANAVGISEELLTAKNYRSASHRAQANEQLNELRDGLLQWFEPADRDLMIKSALVINAFAAPAARLSMRSTPSIDYSTPSTTDEEKALLDNEERKYRYGISSPVDYVIATNPDIRSREEAQILIARNLVESAAVSVRALEGAPEEAE